MGILVANLELLAGVTTEDCAVCCCFCFCFVFVVVEYAKSNEQRLPTG